VAAGALSRRGALAPARWHPRWHPKELAVNPGTRAVSVRARTGCVRRSEALATGRSCSSMCLLLLRCDSGDVLCVLPSAVEMAAWGRARPFSRLLEGKSSGRRRRAPAPPTTHKRRTTHCPRPHTPAPPRAKHAQSILAHSPHARPQRRAHSFCRGEPLARAAARRS